MVAPVQTASLVNSAGEGWVYATLVGTGEAAPDTAPVVSNVSPVASSSIASTTPLLQRITDAEALSGVVIQVRYAGVWEVAYSGSLVLGSWDGSFGPNYTASSITPATGGYDFSLVRTGGWGVDGTALEILPFATDGNTND